VSDENRLCGATPDPCRWHDPAVDPKAGLPLMAALSCLAMLHGVVAAFFLACICVVLPRLRLRQHPGHRLVRDAGSVPFLRHQYNHPADWMRRIDSLAASKPWPDLEPRAMAAAVAGPSDAQFADEPAQDDVAIAPAGRLRDLVEAARLTRNVPIRLKVDGEGAGVGIDPDSFDTAIAALLDNAIETGGGEPVQVRLRQHALTVTIDIVDHGPVASPALIRDEVSRPVVGIGESRAREILRRAGGDLLALSQPNGGMTMRLVLPRAPSLTDVPASP
jgi:hypothetical protein